MSESPMNSYNPTSLLSESLKSSPGIQFERCDSVPSMFTAPGSNFASSFDQPKFQMDFIPTLLDDIDNIHRDSDELDGHDFDQHDDGLDQDFPFVGSLDEMNMLENREDDKDEQVGALMNKLSKAPKRISSVPSAQLESLLKEFEDLKTFQESLRTSFVH